MKRNKIIYWMTVFFSILIVFLTLNLPQTWYSESDLENIQCGWPFAFVQGKSMRDPPFPWRSGCLNGLGGGLMDIGGLAQFLLVPFLLNVGIIFGALISLGFFFTNKRKSIRKKK